ncbi:carbohydrate ABC transporter permease [Alicyclobacillus fodiniaquatilis]|uniref:Carbohydrate ABC transporter permease n=1 Tax=Alicyclobacillus fodiniaquatilis TaxID=1661150 RepID=A0ABW4JP34_9BACL
MVKTTQDRVFNGVVVLILGVVGAICLFPLLFVASASLTPFADILKNGGYVLIPSSITFSAYQELLKYAGVVRAFGVTVTITVLGTLINMVLTTLMSYALSRKELPGRSLFLFMVVFTLLFSGGLIPLYLVVRATGLTNTIWAMIIPNAIWSFNVLVMKSFFENLPGELFEAARMDGSGEFRMLWQIVIPLSVPVMLTIGLFYGVGHWNEYFQGIMYITNTNLYPLQVVIDNILTQSQQSIENVDATVPTMTIQMAAVVIASLPIIVVYPFLQKHFTKGMLIGSIKG